MEKYFLLLIYNKIIMIFVFQFLVSSVQLVSKRNNGTMIMMTIRHMYICDVCLFGLLYKQCSTSFLVNNREKLKKYTKKA